MTEEELQAAIEEAVSKATADLEAKHNEDIKGLKTKNSELINNNKSLKNAADELEEATAEASGNIDQLKASHQKALDKLARERDEAFAARDTLMIDNVIASDLVAHNVSKPFHNILTQALKSQAKVEGDSAVISGQSISEYISEFLSGDDGKHYVAAPKNTGAGAIGSTSTVSGDTEFTKDNFNLTKWSELAKSDPSKANAIAEKIGVPYRAE